ncbi:Lrp/AsnC family transcriptional regulator [Kordiimonas aquimaris]|uniref:Lrp/AsnC family transcriptional regulator n=1 Tax=Kordiimonas aquimaris TaxID=707591 RepID=UPI0021CE0D09|nr:Lrp/AsnC family transcriptional regulator [Kordiimonas aquimaris]
MDTIDQKILKELQKDGRITNNELAAKVNLSPSPCLRRVKKLERKGFVTGYTAVLDQNKCGWPISVFAMIRLERHDEATVQAFENRIQNMDMIVECFLMAGSADYLVHIVGKSLSDYESFVKLSLHTVPGIASIESHIAYGTVKRSYQLPQ